MPEGMTQPLSNDLRKRIVEAVEGGLSCNAAAGHYKVAVSTVVRLMQRWRQTGSWQPLPQGGYFGHKLSPYREQVEQILAGQRDLTLAEIADRLEAAGISVSKSAVDRFLYHLGQRFKKNTVRRRAGQGGRGRSAGGVERSAART